MNNLRQHRNTAPVSRGLTILAAALLITFGQLAFAAEGYIPDANGCKAYDPNPIVGESITWTGGCKDGLLDGQGTLSWTVNGQADDSTTGNFAKGKAEGQGVRLYKSGARYEGEFANGFPEGQGKMTYPNGAVYVGSFVRSRREGHGVVTFPGGQRYEGDFKGGFVGQGTLAYANGAHVTGRFDGPPFDDAIYTQADGSEFKGVFLGRSRSDTAEKHWQDAFLQQLAAGLSSDSHTAARGLVAGLLRITFSADGSPASFTLEGSSGSAELDNQVLSLAKAEKDLPPFPHPEQVAIVTFGDVVKGNSTQTAGAGQAPSSYTIKNSGATGSIMARNMTQGLRVDPEKPWADLSADEQQVVRSRYSSMPTGDEPPYPINGPAKLIRGTNELARRYGPEGVLSLVVDINDKGQATAVSVLSSPSDDLVKDVATLLMVQKYKPAVCHGQPCKMQYPFSLNFVGRADRMNQ